MAQIGIITEQNDLGMGFDVLNPEDQKTYNESANNNNGQNNGNNGNRK